ncbi:hypothetical protein JMN32_14435 [Fulvivirga sp. 29W222]|uniref:ABC transporter ATPase n=1 Tax=Fulvivirga marina TaxID=2494733 RepID=A0A937KCG9_9BACT|nr:hypothetical protein [Fulvivirga marina]MBL6447512.1 hypothetical protein [Fulvivirga marina]
MLVPFENMPDDARVWIYQANRKLANTEVVSVNDAGVNFFEEWAAHGAPLKSSFKIFHNQFLVISADENFNKASGCSIDSSVGFVKQIEQQLGINFFDRTKIAFIFNEEVYLESLSNLKTSVAEGKIDESTLTFNNLVSNKSELETSWIVPAKSTWLGRYFS